MNSPPASSAFPNQALPIAALVICALTIARLLGLALSSVELFFDEAQYWSWSRELAFGYFSKPPMVAWLIAAAGHVCGDSEACVRAPVPLMFLGTSFLAYAIGRAHTQGSSFRETSAVPEPGRKLPNRRKRVRPPQSAMPPSVVWKSSQMRAHATTTNIELRRRKARRSTAPIRGVGQSSAHRLRVPRLARPGWGMLRKLGASS